MKDELTVIQKYAAIIKMNSNTTVPWYVWRCFNAQQKYVSIVGTAVCLGEDYVTITQARKAVQWYVEQLGGSVKWEKI